jgi:hypothetical protein
MVARRILCVSALVACFQLVASDGWAAENWLLEIHGNVASAPGVVRVAPAAAQDDCANTGGPTCSAARGLGTICGDTGDEVISLSECGPGWFKCFLSECQGGFVPVELRLVVRLTPPVGGVDYDLYLYEPCGTLVASSAHGPGEAEEASSIVSDAPGMDDSRFFYVEIRSQGTSEVQDSGAGLATRRLLVESHPNPMNTASLIRYTLPAASAVRVTILDPRGRLVRSFDGGIRPAGTHAIRWDGRDVRGGEVPPGIYFVRVEALGACGLNKAIVLH